MKKRKEKRMMEGRMKPMLKGGKTDRNKGKEGKLSK